MRYRYIKSIINKYKYFIIGITFASSLFLLYYSTRFNDNNHRSLSSIDITIRSQMPLILMWTQFFRTNHVETMIAAQHRHNCTFRCQLSDDRTLIEYANAVIFHGIFDIYLNDLPKIRNDNQYYIFYLFESPSTMETMRRANLRTTRRAFYNLTMTYRTDSDIYQPYDRFLSDDRSSTDDQSKVFEKYNWNTVVDVIDGKNANIIQFVSKCTTPSRREKYVEQLSKYIRVDQFGWCSSNAHQRDNVGQCVGDDHDECAQNERRLLRQYRFYLAFENSICSVHYFRYTLKIFRDYVTEKFFRMKHLIVPIVLRNDDYVRWAPKHSYIAVDQFESVKHLAAYLLKLIENKTKYMQYFQWTKHYLADLDSTIVSPCQLCDYLHEAIKERKKKNYDDIDDWWNRGGQCRDPTFVTNLLSTS